MKPENGLVTIDGITYFVSRELASLLGKLITIAIEGDELNTDLRRSCVLDTSEAHAHYFGHTPHMLFNKACEPVSVVFGTEQICEPKEFLTQETADGIGKLVLSLNYANYWYGRKDNEDGENTFQKKCEDRYAKLCDYLEQLTHKDN